MPELDLQLIGQYWRAYSSVMLAAAATAPLAAALAWWQRARLGRPLPAVVAELGLVWGTAPWLWLALLADPDAPGRVHLVPLSDLAALARGPADFFVVQVVANLLVFAPLGFFLPVRFAGSAACWKVLAVGAAASLAIETTQLLAAHGRTFSVDDIMLNAVGAGLAALCSRPWWAARRVGDDDEATRAAELTQHVAGGLSR
ncbi:MAG: VanZ family protein [Micromonosporaceae bacterium]|nr:VanZ family protein [Micromonosporaceae bacterium]